MSGEQRSQEKGAHVEQSLYRTMIDGTFSRLAHSLVAVELELSIFHDTPCPVSIHDLEQMQPSNDRLWAAETAEKWLQVWLQGGPRLQSEGTISWFQTIAQQNGRPMDDVVVGPCQLRSSLHLIAVLVYASLQVKGYPTDAKDPVRAMLTVWLKLARCSEASVLGKESVDDMQRAAILSSRVLYHIILLNSVLSFPEVEKIAREDPSWKAVRRCSSVIPNQMVVWIHAAQVLRLLRNMHPGTAPVWKAAAIYRVAIASWAASLGHIPRSNQSESDRNQADKSSLDSEVVLDGIEFDSPLVELLSADSHSTPMITRKDGEHVSLGNPLNVLETFAFELKDDSVADPFAKGIRNKILVLSKRWNI